MSLIKKITLETPETSLNYDIGAEATNVELQNPVTIDEQKYEIKDLSVFKFICSIIS